MERDKLDFATMKVGSLFRAMFIPTLIGMLSNTLLTLIDGIFVGRGVGEYGIAAVNIVAPLYMVATGIGLMFGIGASVIAGIRLAQGNIKSARIVMTQGFLIASLLAMIIVGLMVLAPDSVLGMLGCSERLYPFALDYMLPLWAAIFFVMIQCIGMMLIRLDGSPRYAMWCQAVPAVINIALDYVMIFPMGMGVRGAAVATSISCVIGGLMVLGYFLWSADRLRFCRLRICGKSLRHSLRNVGYMARLGFATFLSEIAMSVMMITGNYVFMERLREPGVAAYSIACYLFPVVFSIANAVAQSAQPIISYNYGAGLPERVALTLRIALRTAGISGIIVTCGLWLGSRGVVSLFLSSDDAAYSIAVGGLPIFATCAIFFAVNITFIGYYQSIERPVRAIIYTLLRGIVLLVPAFILLPSLTGDAGLWLAIPATEAITTIIIISGSGRGILKL